MNSILEQVRQHFESVRPPAVISAYVFGSHAQDRQHAESDVDVAVLFDYKTTDRASRGDASVRLNSDLVGATHTNDVDVIILNDVSPELSAAVVRHGVRVYCADDAGDHDFQRNAQILDCDLRPFLLRSRRRKLQSLKR